MPGVVTATVLGVVATCEEGVETGGGATPTGELGAGKELTNPDD